MLYISVTEDFSCSQYLMHVIVLVFSYLCVVHLWVAWNISKNVTPFSCVIVYLWFRNTFSSVQLSQSCSTLCDPMNRSTPGLPVHHQHPESTQTHVHWVSDAIQPSHPLSSPSRLAPNLSQHQGLFQWVNSLHEVAKVLEFQLQHQTFQWTL